MLQCLLTLQAAASPFWQMVAGNSAGCIVATMRAITQQVREPFMSKEWHEWHNDQFAKEWCLNPDVGCVDTFSQAHQQQKDRTSVSRPLLPFLGFGTSLPDPAQRSCFYAMKTRIQVSCTGMPGWTSSPQVLHPIQPSYWLTKATRT